MNEKFLNVLEATAAIYCTYLLLPVVHGQLPDLPPWIADAGTVVFVALFVAAASLLTYQRPTVHVSWKQQRDLVPAADVRIKLRAPNYVSPPFEVAFSGRPKGVLTMLLMRYLRSRGLQLTVVPDGAPVRTQMVRSSPIDANTFIGAVDVANGFSVRVVTPARNQTWMWAKVFFAGSTEVHDKFALTYGATASTKPAQLLSKLVHVTSPAEDFIIN